VQSVRIVAHGGDVAEFATRTPVLAVVVYVHTFDVARVLE
jgi:hypothetical protein